MNLSPLGREEYVEQAYFFRALRERMKSNVPAQEVLGSVREEVLATTKLPMAIDFLLAELRHSGVFGPAMVRLGHYFTSFQAFVISEAENERRRFDLRIGLSILEREAEYRCNSPTRQGIFLFQFEALCRNRLGYSRGLTAVAADPAYDETWRSWIEVVSRQVGMVDIADLIYVHSEYYAQRKERELGRRSDATLDEEPRLPPAAYETTVPQSHSALFGEREGRIALANRRKDPLYLFASLHRQLGYPEVPYPEPVDEKAQLLPQIARRLEQLEKRMKLIEEEQRGGVDLTKFYGPQSADES
jgi:hypothetical protein